MKIYLLDINKNMTDAWKQDFNEIESVEIVNDSFENFMTIHPDVEAIVSPANSFGLMDGGYDKAIIDYFGIELMRDVQEAIIWNWYGEQPVGTSMSVYIRDRFRPCGKYDIARNTILIHTPTMRTPEKIIDSRIIYQCMRTTLIEALSEQINSIVIPAFGGCTGGVPCDTISKMMYLAYQQVCNKPNDLNWGYALYIAKLLK